MRSGSARIAVRTCITASVLLSALQPTCPALGFGGHSRHDAEKREIVRMEYAWRAAQLAGNVAELDRLLADDYVGVNVTGQVHTKSQLLNRIRSGSLTLSRIDLRNIRVKVLGDVAVVRVLATVQGVNQGAPLAGDFHFTRIYHQLPSGAWKITNFEAAKVPRQVGRLKHAGARDPYAT